MAGELSSLLARALLGFTIDFERGSLVSLPISADCVRLLDEEGKRIRDLPRLAGVSKEAISMMIGHLERGGFVAVERVEADSRTKLARLEPSGVAARSGYWRRLANVESAWTAHFGAQDVDTLRESLARIAGVDNDSRSHLITGVTVYPAGGRAKLRVPATLPHYPMVLHRGGYPDGS